MTQHHSISKKRDIIPQKWAVSKIVRREEERVQKWAVSKIVRRREENGFEKQSKTLGFLDFLKFLSTLSKIAPRCHTWLESYGS